MSLIKDYCAASASPKGTERHFEQLLGSIPSLPSGSYEAAQKVKRQLLSGRDSLYNSRSFLAHDVVTTRAGNCIGLPLLFASLLEGRGFQPQFQLLVNPRTRFMQEEEKRVFDRLSRELRYDRPELARESVINPACLFDSLEHAVLDFAGTPFETTSADGTIEQYESTRTLSPDEVGSVIYRDRGVLAARGGDFHKAIELASRATTIWSGNRSAFVALACYHLALGNRPDAQQAVHQFEAVGGDDSRYWYDAFQITSDSAYLDKALARYPYFAPALASKAASLAMNDPREARWQYALASHLYASSPAFDLRSFYVNHKDTLKELFGVESVRRTVKEVAENSI